MIFSGSAPMQPVTITLPFSLSAASMAESDSACALSRKPQVLTITRSAPAMLAGQRIALRAQPGDDAFRIHQRLGAAERDEAHRRRAGFRRRVWCGWILGRHCRGASLAPARRQADCGRWRICRSCRAGRTGNRELVRPLRRSRRGAAYRRLGAGLSPFSRGPTKTAARPQVSRTAERRSAGHITTTIVPICTRR